MLKKCLRNATETLNKCLINAIIIIETETETEIELKSQKSKSQNSNSKSKSKSKVYFIKNSKVNFIAKSLFYLKFKSSKVNYIAKSASLHKCQLLYFSISQKSINQMSISSQIPCVLTNVNFHTSWQMSKIHESYEMSIN